MKDKKLIFIGVINMVSMAALIANAIIATSAYGLDLFYAGVNIVLAAINCVIGFSVWKK